MRTNEEKHTGGDHELHIFEEDEQWKAWLNTPDGDFDGLCLAVNDSRSGAIADAGECLNALAGKLLSL